MTEKYLDVSSYQREIDWDAVSRAGFSGVMVKASQGRSENTEGVVSFADPCFEKNVRGASGAGLAVGAYHFLTAKSIAEAKKEAKFFLSVVKPVENKLVLWAAVDAESRHLPHDRALLTKIVRTFCSEVERAGFQPMLYTNPDFLEHRMENPTEYPLWLACWVPGVERKTEPGEGDIPKVGRYENTLLWQWGMYPPGSVPGIPGSVDGDLLLSRAFPPDKKKSAPKALCEGDTVRIRAEKMTALADGRMTAPLYAGGAFVVHCDTYTLSQLKGSRAVLSHNGNTVAAVDVSVLETV